MNESSHNILVAGSPGALVSVINPYLAKKGWAITWPEQNLDIRYGREYLRRFGQNYEVQRIHQTICEAANQPTISARLPVYFDIPFPGPVELASKFKTKAIFSAPLLPPFINIWRAVASVVIDIEGTEVDDLNSLASWTSDLCIPDYLQSLRQTYNSRYQAHLKLFPKVFTITNEAIRQNCLEPLDSFVNSVFCD